MERLEVDVLGYLVSCSCAPAADWDDLAADDRDLKSPMMMSLAVRGGVLCLLFTNREMPCVFGAWSVGVRRLCFLPWGFSRYRACGS